MFLRPFTTTIFKYSGDKAAMHAEENKTIKSLKKAAERNEIKLL